MAEKRYQVFVSSTFKDLEKERWEAVKALMTMDCIVAGMESFPAVDEEQFEYIKEIIDDCDYYLLILGGRYGSLAPDGMGYTEKEYDYARSRDIKVIALVREAPESLPPEKRETDAAQLDRFIKFREKVCADRLVSFWRDERDIQKDVALGMAKAMKKFPAIGWVRANSIASEELLHEINELRKENNTLKNISKNEEFTCMEKLKQKYCLYFKIGDEISVFSVEIDLFCIFRALITRLIDGVYCSTFEKKLHLILCDIVVKTNENIKGNEIIIGEHIIQSIVNAFILLNLIHKVNIGNAMDGEMLLNYKLTEFGRKIASEIFLS
jgi:hypothetical protein